MALMKALPEVINGFRVIEDLGIIKRRRCIIANCKKCNLLFKTTIDHIKRNSFGCSRACSKNRGGTKRLGKIREGMIARCYNKTHVSYSIYNGNSISVCKEWRENSASFYQWALSNGYDDALTLDRIDNAKGYSPENCRWSDKHIQSQNSSQAKLNIDKVTEILKLLKTIQQKDIADMFNVSRATINAIAKNIRWTNVSRES